MARQFISRQILSALGLVKETTWPSLTLPPTFGRYPSLSPSSFQSPSQRSLSGLHYPTSYPSVNRTLYPWEISNVPSDWTTSWTGPWTATNPQLSLTTTSPAAYTIQQFYQSTPLRTDYSHLPISTREAPVVGYRAWKTVSIQHLGRPAKTMLHSTGVSYVWTPGKNTAQCLGGELLEQHPSPSPNCQCGFWVLSNLDTLEELIDHIPYQLVGAVMGWGTVIQHGETGWRAQYAQPIALLDLKTSGANRKLAKQVAKAYGLPIFERDALEMVVKEHDGKLPLELP